MKEIIFYNKFHNGDIHVSRSFVKYIVDKFPKLKISYIHANPTNLLADVNIQCNNNLKINSDQSYIQNDILYFCTWYGTYNKKYLDKYGITLKCLWHIFNDSCKKYLNIDISKENIKTFVPNINFEKFNIKNAQNYLQQINGKKILICNGDVKSAQGYKLDLTSMAFNLSKTFPHHTFFVTNYLENKKLPPNIIFTPSIIKSLPDLNENAYIGSKCDIIIGQLSGVHVFCYNKETIENKTKIITFWRPTKNIVSPYFLEGAYSDKELRNKIIASDSNNHNNCLSLVEKTIKSL
jgi:hypothetical protein